MESRRKITYFLVNLSIFFLLPFSLLYYTYSYSLFDFISALRLFESDEIFKNNHMIVSCTSCCLQLTDKALILADIESFSQHHTLPLRPLQYPRRYLGFDEQPVLTDNMTHVAEVIIGYGGHI